MSKPSRRSPTTVNGDRKEAILTAAIHEFGEKGLAGARVDEIAARSEANKQLIYYYFKSKQGLYDAALGRLIEISHANSQRRALEEHDGWASRVLSQQEELGGADNVTALWRRFWMWEALETDVSDILRERERTAVFQRVVGELKEAQERGEVDGEFDPAMLTLALHAVELFPYLFPQLTKFHVGELPTSKSFQKRQKRTVELLLQHLVPAAKPKPAAKPRAKKRAARPAKQPASD